MEASLTQIILILYITHKLNTMNLLKYPKRISKETNIGFVVIWLASPIYDILVHGFWDWRVEVGYLLCMILVYATMVWVIKKTVWDKRVKQQINDIIERQYNGYRGDKYKSLQQAHKNLRNVLGDDEFLLALQAYERANPKPIYKPININEL